MLINFFFYFILLHITTVDFKSNNQHLTEVQTCSINLRGLTKICINDLGLIGFGVLFFKWTLVGQSCLMFDIYYYI